MGYSQQQLDDIRDHFRKKSNFYRHEGRKKPEWMRTNWNYSQANKTEWYVRDLTKSLILQVKGSELMQSTSFSTDCSIRFSRCQRIRFDKQWHQAMTKKQLDEMLDEAKYTKTMKKKERAEQSDDDDEQQKLLKSQRKKTRRQINKNIKKRDEILSQFTMVDVSKDKMESHLFHGMEFHVLQFSKECRLTTHQIERDIMLNDGRVVKNPLRSTHYIVSDRGQQHFQVRAIKRNADKSYTFVVPQYIKRCLQAGSILPLSPLYLAVLPQATSKFYQQNFDKFGDSFTNNIDLQQLDFILSKMGVGYSPHPELLESISLQHPRSKKRSLCFGLSQIDIVRLRQLGTTIVDSFEDNPNSIILSQQLSQYNIDELEQKIKQYLATYDADVEYIQNIRKDSMFQ